jgi:hypothetical protein
MSAYDSALNRALSSGDRIAAIERLGKLGGLAFFVGVWQLATDPEEDSAIAEAAGRAVGRILNDGLRMDQGQLGYFTESSERGFLEMYEGPWQS